MSNCHSSNVINSFLRKGVRIKFKNGEVRIGLLLNKEIAEKQEEILQNAIQKRMGG